MEDKSNTPTNNGAPNEANPSPIEPVSEPTQPPSTLDAAAAPPIVEQPAKPPPPPPPHPWTQAKRDLISRAIYYVIFNLAVYGFYLFAEAHGYWPLFFVFITAVMFAIEYRYKAKKYKNFDVPPHIAYTSGSDEHQPSDTTQPS